MVKVQGKINYLLILLGVLVLFVMIAFGYLVSSWNNKPEVAVLATPGTDGALPAPVPWPTYMDDTYRFDYPPDWKVNAGSQAIESQYGGDYVQVVSPNPAVTIEIAPAPFNYSFGSDVTRSTGDEVEIIVNGQKYFGTEDVRTEAGKTKIFADIKVPMGSKEYHVLFGTGYPVNNDESANSNFYQEYKITILRILSTLQINPQ